MADVASHPKRSISFSCSAFRLQSRCFRTPHQHLELLDHSKEQIADYHDGRDNEDRRLPEAPAVMPALPFPL